MKRVGPFVLFAAATSLMLACGQASAGTPTEYQPDFNRGYNAGYLLGYDQGWTNGEASGKKEGASKGHDAGYQAGWDVAYGPAYDAAFGETFDIGLEDGYVDGLNYGFDSGVAWAHVVSSIISTSGISYGVSGSTLSMELVFGSGVNVFSGIRWRDPFNSGSAGTLSVSAGPVDWAAHYYGLGFGEGKTAGISKGADDGYDAAFPAAFSAAYDAAYPVGLEEGASEGTLMGQLDGYDAGWYLGFDQGEVEGFEFGVNYYAVVGSAALADISREARGSIPEPSTLAMMGLALAACTSKPVRRQMGV